MGSNLTPTAFQACTPGLIPLPVKWAMVRVHNSTAATVGVGERSAVEVIEIRSTFVFSVDTIPPHWLLPFMPSPQP
jgi:hypothetical protein